MDELEHREPGYHVGADIICPHDVDGDCEGCRLRVLCLPSALAHADIRALEEIVEQHRLLARNEVVFREDERFTALYVVLSGAIKTFATLRDGHYQVTGCHLPGELFGFSAIEHARYVETAVAVAESAVCRLPYDDLAELCRRIPGLQSRLLHLMSRRIVENHERISQLFDRMPSRRRLSTFLLGLSSRAARRGESENRISLPMTHVDIGNYLGLAQETISRELSRLAADGVIARKGREITILDAEQLRHPLCNR